MRNTHLVMVRRKNFGRKFYFLTRKKIGQNLIFLKAKFGNVGEHSTPSDSLDQTLGVHFLLHIVDSFILTISVPISK